MLKWLALFLFIACEPSHTPPKITAGELKFIQEMAKKNEGLKELSMRFGESYRLDFNNNNFFIKGEDYCSQGVPECIRVGEAEFSWCVKTCEKNKGFESLDLLYSCKNFIYKGEYVAGHCSAHEYRWVCNCNNQVKNIKKKNIEGQSD